MKAKSIKVGDNYIVRVGAERTVVRVVTLTGSRFTGTNLKTNRSISGSVRRLQREATEKDMKAMESGGYIPPRLSYQVW